MLECSEARWREQRRRGTGVQIQTQTKGNTNAVYEGAVWAITQSAGVPFGASVVLDVTNCQIQRISDSKFWVSPEESKQSKIQTDTV